MATPNNLYPDLQFEEINDSPRPIQITSNNRIGVVGEFRKGALTFKLASDFDTFKSRYGLSTQLGSIATRAAMDQGADDFGLIRVLGTAKKATGTLQFTVPTPASVTAGNLLFDLEVYDTDGVTLLRSAQATIPVLAGQTADQIATAAAAALTADVDVSADVSAVFTAAGAVTIQAKVAGLAGNFYKIKLSDGAPVPGGVTYAPSAFTNLSGGADGPARASVVVQDNTGTPADLLVFSAANEGVWGNNLTITISAGNLTGKFNLIVTDTETGEEEAYTDLDVLADSLAPSTNELKKLQSSGLIRATYVGANNSLVPEILTDAALSGGTNGPTITVDDYLAALAVLAQNQANIILAAGQVNNSIRSALIAQAETSDLISGLRIAVLNADKTMALETLETVTQPFNTNTGSAVMVAGWATYAGDNKLAQLSAPPDGFYAGHLAVTPPQVSPAARSSSPFFQNVSATDAITTGQAFNAYTKARMEAIVQDPATGGFHCLNGRTLSSDGAWYWISVRRVYNQIKTDIFRTIQWVKSQPNTPALRSALAQQLDGYMRELKDRGIIANFKPSVVDSSNNTAQAIASGFLRADVFFEPVVPADHVLIGVRRFLSVSVTA